MKRTIYCMLVLAMTCMGFVSCGGDDDDNSPHGPGSGSISSDDPTIVPSGALTGKFSVGTGQVYFSKGNLQATTIDNGKNWTWSFAENQWDYVGNSVANNNITYNGSVSKNGRVDLFGWSTSATYFGINSSMDNQDYLGDFMDWGNTIGDGWYTLSRAEWKHLFRVHKFGLAEVCDRRGVVILPHDFTDPHKSNGSEAFVSYTRYNTVTNAYTKDDWLIMESAGAVFLPFAGYRNGSSVREVDDDAFYWSSTPDVSGGTSNSCISYMFNYGGFLNNDEVWINNRFWGMSVRLVHPVE